MTPIEALKFIADHDLSCADLTACGHMAHGFVGIARAALERAEPVAVLAEREACAQLCDRFANRMMSAEECAAAIRTRGQQAEPVVEPVVMQYIALCDAMRYSERKDEWLSPEEHAESLVAEIDRLKQQAELVAPMFPTVKLGDCPVCGKALEKTWVTSARVVTVRRK